MTKGTETGIDCPWCNKMNSKIWEEFIDTDTEDETPLDWKCVHCGKMMRVVASTPVVLRAEKITDES